MSDTANDQKRQRDNVTEEDSNDGGKRHREDRDSPPQRGCEEGKTLGEDDSESKYESFTKEELMEMMKERDRQRKNYSFESLLAVSPESIRLSGGNGFSHVNGNHTSAESTEVDFRLAAPDQNKIKSMHRPSHVLNEFVDQNHVEGSELKFLPKSYGSEADICHFVALAVKDSICIVEAEGNAKVGELVAKMERSLFGCRPDIMVVRDKDGVGLVAIEVKQPVSEEDKLINHGRVLGHAYDHAAAMNAFGQGTAIVMITSFKESYLCSLNKSDFASNETGQAEADTSEPKSGASQAFSQTQSPPQTKSPPRVPPITNVVSYGYSSAASSNGSSPANSLSNEVSPSVHGTESEGVFVESGMEEDRMVYRTKMYGSHELVKLVYNAIKLARTKYEASTKTICKLENGKRYTFDKALCVVAGGAKAEYHWGKFLRVTLNKKISRQRATSSRGRRKATPLDGDNSYYIIGSLGHGSTSNVYQALDSSGKHVALKVYVKNVGDDDEGKVLDQKAFLEKAEEATKLEAERLCKFYPFLKDVVKTTKVFGLHCVVMPFFKPVEKEERQDMLGKIKAVLNGPFKKYGLRYNVDDVRWRHVGTYSGGNSEEECVLYDLADLEEFEVDEDNHFGDLVAKWKRRIGPEPQKETAVYVTSTSSTSSTSASKN